MSGHSKWASIKHKKAANDAKRGNIFTKLANDITVAAKLGGGGQATNPSLRLAVEKAHQANMPGDNISRAIKRGTGELGGAAVEQLRYEGFGPAGVTLLIEVLTDNRNRSNADLRNILSKNGGRMVEGGGVSYQFTQKGVIRAEVPARKSQAFEEAVIEGGADDYQLGDGFATSYVRLEDLHSLKERIELAGFGVTSAGIEWLPTTPIEIEDAEMEKVAKLLESLEEYDDVTNVYTNLAEAG